MALQYPFVAPDVPLRWDEKSWVVDVCPITEIALVTANELVRFNKNERDNLRPLGNAVCALVAESGEEDDDDDSSSSQPPAHRPPPHRPPPAGTSSSSSSQAVPAAQPNNE